MQAPDERSRVAVALAAGGAVAPQAEADALLAAADERGASVDALLERRLRGEPLAWITGSVRFCGVVVRVERGVFVPRPHTEVLARRAVELLPSDGIAVDLCTGTGAVAVVLARARPAATIVATDADAVAVACARANGVQALLGDLDAPLPRELRGHIDVLTAVVPYVPSAELHLLPRDVLAYEPRAALDGGVRGTEVLLRAVDVAAGWLAHGGAGCSSSAVTKRPRSGGSFAIAVSRRSASSATQTAAIGRSRLEGVAVDIYPYGYMIPATWHGRRRRRTRSTRWPSRAGGRSWTCSSTGRSR
jgi:release factor glutamine methyltransferase